MTVTCMDGDEAQVSAYSPDGNDEFDESGVQSTICMDYHIIARMEDDIRRAEKRNANPESAMPDRGVDDPDQMQRIVDELAATRQLHSSRRPTLGSISLAPPRDGFLPPISPTSQRQSRSLSRSQSRVARNDSTTSTPKRQRHQSNSMRSSMAQSVVRSSSSTPFPPSPAKRNGYRQASTSERFLQPLSGRVSSTGMNPSPPERRLGGRSSDFSSGAPYGRASQQLSSSRPQLASINLNGLSADDIKSSRNVFPLKVAGSGEDNAEISAIPFADNISASRY